MLSLRKADERGRSERPWLDSRHTFSFADYYDPEFRGFRALRVINEDRVAPGGGFARHPHQDMEIITYVLEGALQHQDSLGNGSTIRPGEAQIMSAGSGITHSEYNASGAAPVHFLQIWIVPERGGLPPGYQQKRFTLEAGEFRLLGSQPGSASGIVIHQDVKLYAATLPSGRQAKLAIAPDRYAWVQIAKGRVTLNGTDLTAGDGAALGAETALHFSAGEDSELLVFDLA